MKHAVNPLALMHHADWHVLVIASV